jgi:CTP synthase (UTP-ammonia lyase)
LGGGDAQMSATPILDAMKGFQRDIRNAAVMEIKVDLLNWLEEEIKTGHIRQTRAIDKIIKKVHELK